MVVNSQSGEVTQRIDYDAWGNITYVQNEDEFTDIGFAGGLYDKHTGLIRFGARDYDPVAGRWTAKDPILFGGGTSNLYEYALNDPVNRVDPNGLQSIWDIRDFAAGFTNVISLGASNWILDQLGSAGRRDECSTAYAAGTYAGMAADMALGGKGLLNLARRGTVRAAKKGSHVVYQGVDKSGVVRYVGRTKRAPSVRFGEHRNAIGTGRELLQYSERAKGLTKTQARVLEQQLINKFGLQKNGGSLLNKINSIAPKYWQQHGIR